MTTVPTLKVIYSLNFSRTNRNFKDLLNIKAEMESNNINNPIVSLSKI